MLDSSHSSTLAPDLRRPRRRARRRAHPRTVGPAFVRMALLLLCSGVLGLLALGGGWLLGAAIWGQNGTDGWLLPRVAAVVPGGTDLQSLVQPVAQAQASPAPETPASTGSPPIPTLAGRRLVTYYGHPNSAIMGILGEYTPQQVVARLRQQAAAYEADGRPVQPALHLIATVAQNAPGNDGMYRGRVGAEMIETWSQLAEENEMLLFLDVQTGRSTVQEEVEVLRPWLTRSHVHLALDPEFSMDSTTVPGRQLGTMDAADINWAIDYLAEIAATHRLENRVLLVHQFDESMIRNRDAIKPNLRVDFAICMDGFGNPALKIGQYRRYVSNDPVEYASIKLFYKHDVPLMTPREVLALDPPPDIVVYQ